MDVIESGIGEPFGISGFGHKLSRHTEMKLALYGNDTNR
jgi:hypothetical protein